ncbi:hypothetical protein NDU88_001853 [Pleurodeles waltl]|uniref:Uncharacterized protein n=1 Tax=Pleurodeles waltl TaxID=8319 RepID=A0AAV7KRC2_PLEWA|nr:hypothetical protein NDU88_001853 [Pleurodeles waltl]
MATSVSEDPKGESSFQEKLTSPTAQAKNEAYTLAMAYRFAWLEQTDESDALEPNPQGHSEAEAKALTQELSLMLVAGSDEESLDAHALPQTPPSKA